jgi:hypothetical protein
LLEFDVHGSLIVIVQWLIRVDLDGLFVQTQGLFKFLMFVGIAAFVLQFHVRTSWLLYRLLLWFGSFFFLSWWLLELWLIMSCLAAHMFHHFLKVEVMAWER